MLRSIWPSCLTATTALLAFLIPTEIAWAQIQVSPIILQLQTEQGQAQGVISVANSSDEDFRARLYALPFTYSVEGFQELESHPQDLVPYLTFAPRELDVAAGQTRRVRLVARFLPSTPPGEYRSVLFAEDLREIIAEEDQQVVAIKPRVGITVYVRHGEVVPQLLAEQATYNPETQQISLRVTNSGEASAIVAADWQLFNAGQPIATGRTDKYSAVTQTERLLLLDLSNIQSLETGTYQLAGTLEWLEPNELMQLPFDLELKIAPIATTGQE